MILDAEKLQNFIAQGDKSPPPVFVGRDGVLKDIEEAGATAWKGRSETIAGKEVTHGVAGMTRIVQGAPGAGKSSILAKLFSRSSERHGAPGQSRVLTVGSRQLLDNLPDVLHAVAAAACLEPVRWRKFLPNLSVGVDGAGVPGVSLGFAKAPDVPAPENLSDLARQRPRDRWQAPVIVAVDEAQRLPGNATDPHALFLQGIHDADAGLPLSLVLAGLGDTAERAKAMGLTRGLTVQEVGGLTPKESAELMQGFCLHFGIDSSGHGPRLEALATPCEGWPRHLHFAMQALGREALRREGDLARADWARCDVAAAESRLSYYRSQQSAEMKESDGLVAFVMSRLAKGTKMSGAMRLIEENVVKEVAGHRLPKGLDVNDFYTHLVHRGALQERADGTLHCPIPSFRTYLVHAGGLHPDAGVDASPAQRRAVDKDPEASGTRKDGDDGTGVGF